MLVTGKIAGGPTRLRAKALFGAAVDEAAARFADRVLGITKGQFAGRTLGPGLGSTASPPSRAAAATLPT